MKGDSGARTFADLVKLVEDVHERTIRIEIAIAGDPIAGVPGLQSRVALLERDRGHRRLFQVMVAVGTLVGSAVGAASTAILGTTR